MHFLAEGRSSALFATLALFLVRLSDSVQQSGNTYDSLERLSHVGVLDLLLTGFCPAITRMSFAVTGMAPARLDLSVLPAGKDAVRSLAGGGSGAGSMDGGFVLSASDLPGAVAHSGTTFDIVGCVGVVILGIVGTTAAMDRLPRLRRLAKPSASGSGAPSPNRGSSSSASGGGWLGCRVCVR